jgi:hypothetical protein
MFGNIERSMPIGGMWQMMPLVKILPILNQCLLQRGVLLGMGQHPQWLLQSKMWANSVSKVNQPNTWCVAFASVLNHEISQSDIDVPHTQLRCGDERR